MATRLNNWKRMLRSSSSRPPAQLSRWNAANLFSARENTAFDNQRGFSCLKLVKIILRLWLSGVMCEMMLGNNSIRKFFIHKCWRSLWIFVMEGTYELTSFEQSKQKLKSFECCEKSGGRWMLCGRTEFKAADMCSMTACFWFENVRRKHESLAKESSVNKQRKQEKNLNQCIFHWIDEVSSKL